MPKNALGSTLHLREPSQRPQAAAVDGPRWDTPTAAENTVEKYRWSREEPKNTTWDNGIAKASLRKRRHWQRCENYSGVSTYGKIQRKAKQWATQGVRQVSSCNRQWLQDNQSALGLLFAPDSGFRHTSYQFRSQKLVWSLGCSSVSSSLQHRN